MNLEEKQNNKIKVPWFFSWWMIAIAAVFTYSSMGILGFILILLLLGRFSYVISMKSKLELQQLADEKARLQSDIQLLKSEKTLLQTDKENNEKH